jgi:hypothetical protein
VLDLGSQVLSRDVAAAAQVDGDLDVGARDRPADHRLAEVAAVLDPVTDHAQPGQVSGRGADRLDDRAERRPHRGRFPQLLYWPEVNVHREPPSRG